MERGEEEMIEKEGRKAERLLEGTNVVKVNLPILSEPLPSTAFINSQLPPLKDLLDDPEEAHGTQRLPKYTVRPPKSKREEATDPHMAYFERIKFAANEGYFPLFFHSVRRYLNAGNRATPELYSLCLQACAHQQWKKGQLAWLAGKLIEEMQDIGMHPTQTDWVNAFKAIGRSADWMEREWAWGQMDAAFVKVSEADRIIAYVSGEELERAVDLAEKIVREGKEVPTEAAKELILGLCGVDEADEAHRLLSVLRITPAPEDQHTWLLILECAARTLHSPLASLSFFKVPAHLRTEWILENVLFACLRRPYLKLTNSCIQQLFFYNRWRSAHGEAQVLIHFQHLIHHPTITDFYVCLRLVNRHRFVGATLVQGIAARLGRIPSPLLDEMLAIAEEEGTNARIILCTLIRAGKFEEAKAMIQEKENWAGRIKELYWTSTRKEMLRDVVASLIAYVGAKGDKPEDDVIRFTTEAVLGEVLREIGEDRVLCVAILELAAILGETKAMHGILALMKAKDWEVPKRLDRAVDATSTVAFQPGR